MKQETIGEIKARMTPEDLAAYDVAGKRLKALVESTTAPHVASQFVAEIGLGLIGAENLGLISYDDISIILQAVKEGVLEANRIGLKYGLDNKPPVDPEAN